MHELGLLDEFLELPHQEVRQLTAQIGDAGSRVADFTHLPTALQIHRLHAAMGLSQFPCRAGQRYPDFRPADAGRGDRPDRRGRTRRRRARDDAGRRRSRSAPTSWSAPTAGIRRCASAPASPSTNLGAPMDVLWMRISRRPDDPRPDARPFRRRPHAGHARSRRLLAVRLRHPARAASTTIDGAGPDGVPRRSSRIAPLLRDRVDELSELGRRQAADRAVDRLRSGIGRACCASATPRTRCRRSAASASISRSRMRSRRPIFLARHLRAGSLTTEDDLRRCSAGANARCGSSRASSCWCRTGSSAGSWPRPSHRSRPWRCGCLIGYRRCSEFLRVLLVSACSASTCTRQTLVRANLSQGRRPRPALCLPLRKSL